MTEDKREDGMSEEELAAAAELESLGMEQGVPEVVDQEQPEENLEARLRAEAEANYDKYIRAVAELENFKKRAAKERSELLKYSGEHLARDLLDVADNFERAIAQYVPTGNDAFYEGVKLILNGLRQTFDRHSIRGESALGEPFNPIKHEALASVPTAEKSPGTILEEYRKAYYLKDKLLRVGQVVVAIEPPSQSAAPASSEEDTPAAGGDEGSEEPTES